MTIVAEMSDEYYDSDVREQVENPESLREMEEEEMENPEMHSFNVTLELLES